MHARDTTSRRRRSDTLEKEAQLQAWEDDGGKTVISINPVRVLIIDNDIGSADSLELMLHASGYSERALHIQATLHWRSRLAFSPTSSCSISLCSI